MVELNEQELMLVDGGDFGELCYSAGKTVGKALRKVCIFVVKKRKEIPRILPGVVLR